MKQEPKQGISKRSRSMQKMAPLFAIIAVSLWGMSFVAGKIAYEQLTPFELLYIRMVISFIAFIPYIVWRVVKVGIPDKKHFLLLVVVGILSFPATLGFQFAGLQYMEASISSIAVGLEVAFTMLAAYIVLKQKPTIINYIVSILALIGLLVALGIPNKAHIIGVLFITCANISASFAIVFSKPLLKKFSATDITAYSILIGTLTVIIVSPFFGSFPQIKTLHSEVIAMVLFLSIGATVIAYFLHTLCLKYLSATRTSQFIVIEPIIGVLSAVLILGEPFTLQIALGSILVITAIILNSLVDDAN